MAKNLQGPLRTGFTTGTCATAAAMAAGRALLTDVWVDPVRVSLPKGGGATLPLSRRETGDGWACAGVIKDAGDDPDVTHGALIVATVRLSDGGVVFKAGPGVGRVTRPGLPIPPGEPAINPVPRRMITEALREIARACRVPADFEVELSIPGGEAIAERTWNPRLGIEGGLSILGTTGIVRPFSCAAWIASIHRGIDVARAAGARHVAGSTGATSEAVAQARFGLPDHAMLDMGDFAGGMLKYLRVHPVPRVTIAGGFGKLVKLAQGALDLHSARSRVDFERLARWADEVGGAARAVARANTAQQALELTGPALAERVAERARDLAAGMLSGTGSKIDVLIVDRQGRAVAFRD
ncbi:MAG: cobalt-precorrin-5B (C(1))-methyltransferase [Pseudomonadota bacterium]